MAARLTERLHSFAQGLGLDEATVRQIVDRVIADMPLMPDEDRVTKARHWMLIAAA